MSSCFFMSTDPLLPETYITILSLVTTPPVYIAVGGLCVEFTDDRWRRPPVAEAGGGRAATETVEPSRGLARFA